MTQDLFGPVPEPEHEETTEERFERFHRQNPHVYAALVKHSRQMRQRVKRWSIAGAIEVARYFLIRDTATDEEFKISNDFKPYYARLIMAENPDLEGLFVTKEMFANGEYEPASSRQSSQNKEAMPC